MFSEEAYANPNTDAHPKKNSFFLYLIHCNNEPDPSLNTRLILLSFCPIQPPFASGVFLLHLPESAARSSPSVASAGREDLGKAFRDWDPWGPFFFIVFLGLTLSWSASVKKVKLGELEAELFVIKAINDNLWHPYNELVEFRYPRNCSYTDKSFLGSFRGHIESGRDPENYLKYSVQDIERIVLDFFEEYSHVTPAKLEDTMKKKIGEVGNKDSVVQINCVGDMSVKSLLKDGFVFEHDFLQVVAAVHIGWILLFVFICGIKSLNF
ncbi:unnamed protein product [Brassica rapa subsp. narinosa]